MATVELHGLEPGETANLHLRTSSPIVPESPGAVLAHHKVGKDGSVRFDGLDAGAGYVVRCGERTVEVLAKDEPAKPLPAPEEGADVRSGPRTTASRRRR
jgi:hypothetical protein